MSGMTSTDEKCIKDVTFTIEARRALTQVGKKHLYPEFNFDFAKITRCIDLAESEISEALLIAYFAGCKCKRNLTS